MKRRTRVREGRRSGKIASLKASAEQGKGSHDLIAGIGSLYRPIKKAVTLRLDADVLAWFKKPGRGYQTRINRALRAVMMEERKDSGK
jgi:uncharacterized protein (DUF4415 family)